MNRNASVFKWCVLFVLVAGMAMMNFSNTVFASRPTEVMSQFNMTQAQLTVITSIGVLPGAFFSILMGTYFDRHGAKSIRTIGAVLLALAAVCQVWRVFADSYVQLVAITFLAGAFFLPTQVLPAKMIEAWFPRTEIGTAMGIYGAAGGIGITIAFAIGTLFPTTASALGFCAGGYIVIALFWCVFGRMPAHGDAKETTQTAGAAGVSVKAVLKSKSMWCVMLCGGIASAAPLLYNSYVVNAFLAQGMAQSATSMLAVVFNVGLVVGAIACGAIVSKLGRYNATYLVISVCGGVALLASFVLPVGAWTFVLTLVAGFFLGGTVSVNLARIGLIPLTGDFGPENIGIAGGMNNTAMGVFMFALPTVTSAVFGTNYLAIFVMLLVFSLLLAFLGGVALPELGEKGSLAREACRERMDAGASCEAHAS